MSLGTLLLIVLILMLVGAIPTWPHSKSWGYAPSGGGQPNRDTRHASNTQPHIS